MAQQTGKLPICLAGHENGRALVATAATKNAMRLLLLLDVFAAPDPPASSKCGYCGGCWLDRLRVPALG